MGAPVENVFIAWSGEQSKVVAEALHDWLPSVVQRARPWMSEAIESGKRWRDEVNRRLRDVRIGVLCLTPENIRSTWLHFEAGALSRLDDDSRVTPYLVGLKPTDLVEPLPMFQSVVADRDGTMKLVRSINAAMEEQVPAPALEKLFDRMWGELAEIVRSAQTAVPAPPNRSEKEMIEEILVRVRELEPPPLIRDSPELTRFAISLARYRAAPSDAGRRDRFESALTALLNPPPARTDS